MKLLNICRLAIAVVLILGLLLAGQAGAEPLPVQRVSPRRASWRCRRRAAVARETRGLKGTGPPTT